MKTHVGSPGRVRITRKIGMCDACDARMVQPVVEFIGPRGTLELCPPCVATWSLEIMLPELKAIQERWEREQTGNG